MTKVYFGNFISAEPKNSIITQMRTKFYDKVNKSHPVSNAKWGFFIGQTLIINKCCLDPNPVNFFYLISENFYDKIKLFYFTYLRAPRRR